MRSRFLSALLAVLLLLSGCGRAAYTDQPVTELWVVTEQTTWDRMNGQTEVLIKQFQDIHPEVTVRLDILPIQTQERAVYLQQLRTAILRGGGPDAYLLPTDGSLILSEPTQYCYTEVALLFPDPALAMRNGIFQDISTFYDADSTLGKESLVTRIMDAGTVNGARYILPLRYDMPVIYADPDALRQAGLDPAVLEAGIDELMEAVLRLNDPVLACGAICSDFSAFTDFIHYDTGRASLSDEQIARYMTAYQQLQSLVGDHAADLYRLDLKSYIYGYYDAENSLLTRYPMYIGTMEDALGYAAIAKYEERDLIMLPMRSTEGDIVATVTYYAAVGAGCKDPALAYEFLRLFLLEQSQWEKNRPDRKHANAKDYSRDMQYPGLIEAGWPVRAAGSVEDTWRITRTQIYLPYFQGDMQKRMRKICRSPLEEARLPILTADIDQVRFNTTLSQELANALQSLNDLQNGGTPTDADIGQLAERLAWALRWHVSEG